MVEIGVTVCSGSDCGASGWRRVLGLELGDGTIDGTFPVIHDIFGKVVLDLSCTEPNGSMLESTVLKVPVDALESIEVSNTWLHAESRHGSGGAHHVETT